MTTKEIATRLVELCNKADFETAQKELFADEAVSIEPHDTPGFQRETKGKDAIEAKGKKFGETMGEITECSASEPLISANSFVTKLTMTATAKDGKQMPMEELAVYEVKDGKIVSERFFV